MYKLIDFQKKRKNFVFAASSFLILILLLVSPAAASINNWDFSPKGPVSGDILQLKGNAAPGDKVDVLVSFEKTVPVSEGKFEYILEDVKIPGGLNNYFTVQATDAKNLNVRVKMVIWITKSSEASGNVATVSQSSVPEGTYRIKIDGEAKEGASDVNLKITAFQGLEADSNGEFTYSYNTKSVPAGDFEIKVGDTAKTVTIQSREKDQVPDLSPQKPSEEKSSEEKSSGKTSDSSMPVPETTPMKTEPVEQTTSSGEVLKENNTANITAQDKSPENNTSQNNNLADDVQKSEEVQKTGFILDKLYLLAGLGAGLVILVIYSHFRKK